MKIVGSIARNDRFGSLFCEISRKPRTKRSFWKLVLWNFEEASHETIVLEAFCVKIVGSIARNARFASLCCEISKKPRTKRSFWKLFLWKLLEASHKTILLEGVWCNWTTANDKTIADHQPLTTASDAFASFFCEIWKKTRTKRSVWKLFLWNLEEASCDTMFLRASCVKFGGPFARNDHVGSFFCEISVMSFISYDHVISVSLFSSTSRFYILYFQWPWLGEVLLTTNPLITARRCHLYHMIWIAISFLFSSMSRFYILYFQWPWLGEVLLTTNPLITARRCHLYHMIGIAISLLFFPKAPRKGPSKELVQYWPPTW